MAKHVQDSKFSRQSNIAGVDRHFELLRAHKRNNIRSTATTYDQLSPRSMQEQLRYTSVSPFIHDVSTMSGSRRPLSARLPRTVSRNSGDTPLIRPRDLYERCNTLTKAYNGTLEERHRNKNPDKTLHAIHNSDVTFTPRMSQFHETFLRPKTSMSHASLERLKRHKTKLESLNFGQETSVKQHADVQKMQKKAFQMFGFPLQQIQSKRVNPESKMTTKHKAWSVPTESELLLRNRHQLSDVDFERRMWKWLHKVEPLDSDP